MVAGGRRTLRRLRPALLIEFNETHLARAGGSVAGLWKMLEGLGYRARDPGTGARMAPIKRPRQGDILWLSGGKKKR